MGFVISAALLCQWADDTNDTLAAAHLEAAKVTFADKWVAMGVMEDAERERYFVTRWYRKRYEDVLTDVTEDENAMLFRVHRMEPDCPVVDDRLRLPPHDLALRHWIHLVRAVNWLEKHRCFYGPAEQEKIDQMIDDLRWRKLVWGLIADVQATGYSPPEGRRLLLQQLREQVGRRAYENGWWPRPLGEWAYTTPGVLD